MPRLRQVAFATRDLDTASATLARELDLAVAFRDPGVAHFGLHNAVLPVGRDFLEVVAPLRDDAPAARFLARRGGDAGYMAIFQVDDLAAARARAEAAGVRIVFAHAETVRETRVRTETVHLHPRDVGGAIVSLDAAAPPEGWAWAGPDWERHVRTRVATGLAGLDLVADDPAALAARWAAVLGRPARREGAGALRIDLDAGALRFAPARDGRPEGIDAVRLRAAPGVAPGPRGALGATALRLV